MEDNAELKDWHLCDQYEEALYFHPFVRRFLFGCTERDQKAPHLFRRTDVTRVRLEGSKRTFDLDVDRVNLYVFDSDVVVLVVEVSSGNGRAVLDSTPHAPPHHTVMTLADAQTILCRLRRAYPPFWPAFEDPSRNVAGECFRSVQWLRNAAGPPDDPLPAGTDSAAALRETFSKRKAPPVFAHWRALMAGLPLEGYPDGRAGSLPRLCHVVDDRIPSMAMIGVDSPTEITDGDLVRLCFADGPGTDEFPYDPGFLRNFDEKHAYDRFRHTGTRYFCSGYNFVLVGLAHEPDRFTFPRCVLQHHFRRHYFQLGLLNHVQKAALLSLSDDLSEAATADDRQARMERIQERTLTFVHRYWFTDVSNQVQGQELFEWWRRLLGTDAAFAQVTREVGESSAYLNARAALDLNLVAAVGLVLALTTGALGMNVLIGGKWGEASGWGELFMVLGFVTLLGLSGWRFLKRGRVPIRLTPIPTTCRVGPSA